MLFSHIPSEVMHLQCDLAASSTLDPATDPFFQGAKSRLFITEISHYKDTFVSMDLGRLGARRCIWSYKIIA